MGKTREPALTDDQIPKSVKRNITREVVRRYGTLSFWAKLNGFNYYTIKELLRGQTSGKLIGSETYRVKQKLIDEGLWFEPVAKSAAQSTDK
jgi:hypothetical protein